MLTGGKLVLMDFGMAREVESDQLFPPCSAYKPFGKKAYRPPESMTQHWRPKSFDVYSLGCCLFAMLTGEHFVGNAHGSPMFVDAYKNGRLSDWLFQRRLRVPADAVDLLQSMLCTVSKRISLQEVLQHPWVRGDRA